LLSGGFRNAATVVGDLEVEDPIEGKSGKAERKDPVSVCNPCEFMPIKSWCSGELILIIAGIRFVAEEKMKLIGNVLGVKSEGYHHLAPVVRDGTTSRMVSLVIIALGATSPNLKGIREGHSLWTIRPAPIIETIFRKASTERPLSICGILLTFNC